MILRGLTVLPVTIAPRTPADAKAASTAPRAARVEIRYSESRSGKQAGAISAAARFSRGFYDSFGLVVPAGLTGAPIVNGTAAAGFASETAFAAATGSYLIITTPAFAPAVAPFAAWKTEKGFPVTVATTDQTGTTNQQIRDYIARAYQDWSVPPQFVLLVGDVDQIPAFSFHSSTSDHPYSTLDGDDFLPDVSLGRLSARTLQEVETIVAKILRYERDPFVGDDPGWYRRALVVAGDYGSLTPRAVCRWSREQLLLNGYAQVDSCYFPPFFVDYFHTIPTSINAGVSLVSYRGWAYGIHGWEPPHFTSTEIPSLTNGWKLPVVFSFVCQNNDFGQAECFGEAWLRAGTAAEPKGAVAFIGNSEPWSHTRFNDACAIGAFNAIRQGGMRRMGDHPERLEAGVPSRVPGRDPLPRRHGRIGRVLLLHLQPPRRSRDGSLDGHAARSRGGLPGHDPAGHELHRRGGAGRGGTDPARRRPRRPEPERRAPGLRMDG